MSSGISLPDVSARFFEVTVTLTTAGVTRAANVSIALSRASSALTLSTSSGAAEGVAKGAPCGSRFPTFIRYERSDQCQCNHRHRQPPHPFLRAVFQPHFHI